MAEKPKEQVEMAPDPEEDDLDDLDDVLDQFASKPSASKPSASKRTDSSSKPIPSTSGSGPEQPSSGGQETPKHIHGHLPSDADLQNQLQSGMKDLMGELDGNPQMQAEFEKMMQELIQAGQAGTDAEMAEHIGKATAAVAGSDSAIGAAAAEPSTAKETKSAKGSGSGQQENFQDTIRKTMERMQASSSSATEASHSNPALGGGSEEDMLANLMKELGASGGEGEEDFNKMLMSMMAQLTNKEILYEPMKELNDKYPDWMAKNESAVGKEDLARYREQQTLVGEIVGRFERKGYSDEDDGDREFIVERMQKMQAAGSPPPDLVGDMSAAQEALGDLEGGCPTQ